MQALDPVRKKPDRSQQNCPINAKHKKEKSMKFPTIRNMRSFSRPGRGGESFWSGLPALFVLASIFELLPTLVSRSYATDWPVTKLSELRLAINNAASGDSIIMP